MQNNKRAQLLPASVAFLAALTLLIVSDVCAYNNPSLKWRTIKTEHFEVHYHQGTEWTAQQVAAIAEEVHGPLCELYQYEPSNPVHFIIRDTDDYANGAAFFYDNKVEIWATNLEFFYRGTTQWLRNVITHEYAHIVSIQAAMKMTTRVPAIYFQYISFEEERRPDVLQGYPNNIISYPYSGIVYPPWFAEGVSQFQTPNIKYDCWDTHRDMILRCAVLEDAMLTYDEMGFFGKTSMEGEQVYDHGYGLTNFIAMTYGPESIDEITSALRTPWRLNMDGALKKVTGKKGKAIYNDWRAYMKDRYDEQTAEIRENLRTGKLLYGENYKKAYINVQPVFSPDGRTIAFMSNTGNDYAWQTLYTMDRAGKKVKRIRGGVNSAPRFSPDGKTLLYSKKHKVNKHGWLQNDVYAYDIEKKKEKQLTKKARVADVSFSPDGNTFVGVKNGDGTHQIVLVDADGKNERVLLAGPKGTQFYMPQFSPDGKQILFGIFDKGTRDIAVMSADGTGFRYVLGGRTPNDERDVRWSEDGSKLLMACDRTGIFNIYEVDLENQTVARLTNVIGGAFMPDDSPGDGAVVYSLYSANGYSVYLLDGEAEPVETMDLATFVTRDVKPFDECADLKTVAAATSTGMQMVTEDGEKAVPDERLTTVGTGVAGIDGVTPVVSEGPLAAGVSGADAGSSNGARGLWSSGVMGSGGGIGGGGFAGGGLGGSTAAGAGLLGASFREGSDIGDGQMANAASPQTADSITGTEDRTGETSVTPGISAPSGLPIESPYPSQSFDTKKYKSRYSIFQLFPRVVIWDNKLRLGLFATSNEILDKQTLFVGGAYGVDGEYDAYVSYEIRNFYPTIFADFVILRELHSDRSVDEDGNVYVYDTKYNLWQWDIGMRLDLSEPFSLTFQNQL
ncbi:MAG: PD40 domain-containing protein, partial [Candidatus Latescibacterota bacterium]